FLPPLADADLAFAEIAKVVLPIGLRGLVLAASLAAIMSTATACLLATSTVFLEDVYLTLKKSGGTGSVAQSRALTLILGVLAAVVACVMHDVVAALTVGYDLLVGAIFVPIIAAMVFERGASAAAFVSISACAEWRWSEGRFRNGWRPYTLTRSNSFDNISERKRVASARRLCRPGETSRSRYAWAKGTSAGRAAGQSFRTLTYQRAQKSDLKPRIRICSP